MTPPPRAPRLTLAAAAATALLAAAPPPTALAYSPVKIFTGPTRVRFSAPLLEDGYTPAVAEYTRRKRGGGGRGGGGGGGLEGEPAVASLDLDAKPVLLYLPGFDGTLVCPFFQFPELGTTFDVWGMDVPMDGTLGRGARKGRKEGRVEGGMGYV